MFCRDIDQKYYKLLYNLETYLRILVRWELRGSRPRDWLGLIEEDLQKSIKEKQEQEKSVGYLDYHKQGFLSYCNLADLKDIIIGPLWSKSFAQYWGNHDLVAADFKKLIAIRNKLAHFRSITDRDVRTLDNFISYLEDWTENYAKINRFSVDYFCGDSAVHGEKWAANMPHFLEEWLNSFSQKNGNCTAFISKRGPFLCVGLKIEKACFNSNVIEAYINSNEKHVAFLIVGSNGDALDLYYPIDLGDKSLLENLNYLAAVFGDLLPEMSSDEVAVQYRRLVSEAVFIGKIKLPMQFKVSIFS